jgi:hypothetical protein
MCGEGRAEIKFPEQFCELALGVNSVASDGKKCGKRREIVACYFLNINVAIEFGVAYSVFYVALSLKYFIYLYGNAVKNW